jgi:crossover junction endodeoxyribonuclease RusA
VKPSTAASPDLRLTLELPPTSNNLYAQVRGHRVKSKAGREYATYVADQITAHGYVDHFGLNPGPLSLTIALYVKHDRDVDGCKALQDALASALGFNDKIIVELHVTKAVDKRNPRAEVRLAELAPSNAPVRLL